VNIVAIVRIWTAIKPIKRIKRLIEIRKIRKALKEITVDSILSSLRSRTIWLGIATQAWGLTQIFLADGVFTTQAIVSLVTGVAIIFLRAVTTVPLADK